MTRTDIASGRPHRTVPLLLTLLLLLGGTVLPPIAEPAQAAAGAPAGSQAQAYGRTIGTAGNSACAIDVDGLVQCWAMASTSNNTYGQLGTGDTIDRAQYAPVVVGGLTGAVQLSGGNRFFCAAGEDGRVRCWGGVPADRTSSAYRTVLIPELVRKEGGGDLTDIVQVEAGDFTACAVDVRGDVWCWGYQTGGLGVDGSTTPYRPGAVKVVDVAGATAVTVGESFACALTAGGRVRCWGQATAGQLGRTASGSNVPAGEVQGPGGEGVLEGVVAVSAGFRYACALQQDGAVDCWGDNTSGKLGDGTTVSRTYPVRATVLADRVAAISAGWNTTTAVTTDRRPLVIGHVSGAGNPIPNEVFAVDAYSGSENVVCWIGTQPATGEPGVFCQGSRIVGVTPVSVGPAGVPDADLTVVASGGAERGVAWEVIDGKLVIYPNEDPDIKAISINAADLQAALDEGDLAIGAATIDGGPPIIIPEGRTLTFDVAADSTYTGALSGPGSFSKDGAGTLELTGDNTYEGQTTISGGALHLGCTAVPAGPIVNDETLVIDCDQDLTLSNDISGSGALIKDGEGTLTPTGVNTYTGGTTVEGGTLALEGADTSIGTGPITVMDGASLVLKDVDSLPNALFLEGSGVDDRGALRNLSSTPLSFGGAITLTNDVLLSSDGALTFDGPVDGAHILTIETSGDAVALDAAIGGTTPLEGLTVRSNPADSRIPSLHASVSLVVDEVLVVGVEVVSLHEPNVKIGKIAAKDVTDIWLRNEAPIEVGTVDGVDGISADGAVVIETTAGDIRLTQPIATLWAADPAISLHAGLDAEIGDPAGGDLVVSDEGEVSAPNGVVRLYGGSHAGSSGTTDLAGTSNVRTMVDETTSTEDLALRTPGVFALYRAPGPATRIEMVTEPQGGRSGQELATQPSVRLLDPSGNLVASDNHTVVSVEVVSGDGATLGVVSATAVDGVVTFSGITLAGTVGVDYVLRFSAPGLSSVDSSPVLVTHGVAARLGIATQPVAGWQAARLKTQPVIEIQDAQGNRVLDDTTTVVTVTLDPEAGGVLGGSFSATANEGVVTFEDLTLDGRLGVEHLLVFSAPALEQVQSQPLQLRPVPSAPAPEPEPEPRTVCAAFRSTSTFGDVPAFNVHSRSIACLAELGIALGHTDGTYRPADPVRRDEMASFIVRTLEAAGHTLPTGEPTFTDIAGNNHAHAIAKLAAAGIIQGRTSTRYEPGGRLTRGQVASFLVGALDWAQGSTEAAPASPFVDVASTTHARAIHTAYHLELTLGRTPTTYEPGAQVRRDQMATFLSRMLDRAEPLE